MAGIEAGRRLLGPMMPQAWLKDQRRKKEQFAVQLRKGQRNEAARRRRISRMERLEIGQISIPEELLKEFPRLENAEGEERLEMLKEVLITPELYPSTYFSALSVLRLSLSQENSPPIQTLSEAGFIPILAYFIDLSAFSPEIVLEATWALCNLASGPKPVADLIVSSGGIEKLVSVIDQGHQDISETAIWALGNLAEDGPLYRDLILRNDGHLALLSILLEASEMPDSLSQVIGWTLCALTKGQPAVPSSIVQAMLPGLQELAALSDPRTQVEVLQTLGNVTCWETEYCELVAGAGLLRCAVAFLTASEAEFLLPALRVVGNIAACNDCMTQKVLDLHVLDRLEPLLTHSNLGVRKQVLWTLSNIAAGSTAQVSVLMAHSLCWRLLQCFEDSNYFIRKETMWVLSNLVTRGTSQQCAALINADLIGKLGGILAEDVEIARKGMEIVQKLLLTGENEQKRTGNMQNPAAVLIERTGCLGQIERLTTHPNGFLSSESTALLEAYFEPQQVG